MIKLYHGVPSRSMVVHWLLEELGEPYELCIVDLNKDEQRSPAYLAINPMGKVPTLDHDGVIVTETAAIVPRIGDRRRGPYLQWLFFSAGCLEPAIMDRMLKREPGPVRMMGYGSFDAALDHLAGAVDGGRYLLGEGFTAADLVVGSA